MSKSKWLISFGLGNQSHASLVTSFSMVVARRMQTRHDWWPARAPELGSPHANGATPPGSRETNLVWSLAPAGASVDTSWLVQETGMQQQAKERATK